MIIKTPDYQQAIDAINQLLDSGRIQGELKKQLLKEVAGLVAEKQIAFRLGTFFRDSDEIFVYNNFAIPNEDSKTQIDHLVFSRRAIYLIESKSVAGTIHVNENGEFHRQYGKYKESIDSPIEQVKTQKEALVNFLKAHKEKFMGKFLFMQKGVTSWTPKYYVAISEKGTIKRPKHDQFKELMKFDQIASAILEHHKKTDVGFLKSLDDESYETFNLLSKSDIDRVTSFFKESDVSDEPIDKIKSLLKKPV